MIFLTVSHHNHFFLIKKLGRGLGVSQAEVKRSRAGKFQQHEQGKGERRCSP